MNWPLLAGSLAGVLALAGIAWALGLGGGTLADEDEAMRVAMDGLPGFTPRAALLSDDARGALVAGRDGRLAVIAMPGAQPVVRPLPARPAIRRDGAAAILDTGEPGLGALAFSDGDKLLTLL